MLVPGVSFQAFHFYCWKKMPMDDLLSSRLTDPSVKATMLSSGKLEINELTIFLASDGCCVAFFVTSQTINFYEKQRPRWSWLKRWVGIRF